MPEDQIIQALALEFPPVPIISNEENTYRYYIMIQDSSVLEKYTLYLLKDKPVDSQITGQNNIQFLNNEEKTIMMKRYQYMLGNTEWNFTSSTSYSSLNIANIKKHAEYCNFDIFIVNPQPSSSSPTRAAQNRSKIPCNSYKNDGIGGVRNGWTEIDSECYSYKNGERQRGENGWLLCDSNENIKKRELESRTSSETWYYLEPTKNWALSRNCFVKKAGDTYYFDDSGTMVTGEWKINGDTYLFGKDGKYIRMVSGTDTYLVVSDVNVRMKPELGGTLLTTLIENTKVKAILPKNIKSADGYTWIQVYYTGGKKVGL